MGRRTAVIAVFVALIVVLAAIPIGLAMTNNNSDEKEVVNSLMKVKGIEKDGTVSFKNIPYAEAPVGDLRFKAPVLKEADWKDVKDCTKFGNVSIQGLCYNSEDDSAPKEKVTHKDNESEDCLNLNIWAPADAKKGDNLPVYFWIHGGACIVGDGQSEMYDGTAFTKQDIIVVTINYRLGTLGYLGIEAFMDESGTTGNWGTLDQICALKWVNKYIENFGGDPKNITIGGESAGSFSVMNLVLSTKYASGLFQKAIMGSGALMHLLENNWNYEQAVKDSDMIVTELGLNPEGENVLEELRKMDAFKLADASYFNGYLYLDHTHSMWPVADGEVLPKDFLKAIQKGEYNNVKMIIGYNLNEGYLFTSPNVTEKQMNDFIDKVFPKDTDPEKKGGKITADTVKQYYKDQVKKTTYEKMLELVAMTMFKCGTVEALEEFTANGSVVYGYEFSHKTNGNIIAFHGIEEVYAFGQDHFNDIVFDRDDLIIRDAMHQYWVNFIKTGDPNGYGLNVWTPYDPIVGTAMHFAKTTASTEHWIDSSTLYFLKDSYFRWTPPTKT